MATEDMVDTDNSIEGLAKYLVAVIKCTDDNEESVKLVASKLKELMDNDYNTCIEVIKSKEKEFGEVAVRVNRITKEMLQSIEQLRKPVPTKNP